MKLLFSQICFLIYFTASAQIPSGLLVWYPFNGNTLDSSGNGLHATNSGATIAVGKNGIPGTAYAFNGTSSRIDVPDNPLLRPAHRMTIAIWFQPNIKTLTGWGTLLTKRYALTADPYNSYALTTFANGKWNFILSKGTAGTAKSLPTRKTTPYNGNWIFMVCVFDSLNMKTYINGVLDTSTSFVGPIGYSGLGLTIGYTTSGTNDYYQGRIDDLKIFNRDLNQEEINRLYYSNFTNNYFSKSTGRLDSLGTWGSRSDGSGTQPPNFGQSNTGYYVHNRTSTTLTSNWLVAGTNTAIMVGNERDTISLTVPAGIAFGGDSIFVLKKASLHLSGILASNKRGFDDSSLVSYTSANPQSIPGGNYFDLILNNSTKSLSGALLVKGNLHLNAMVETAANSFKLGLNDSFPGRLFHQSGWIIGAFSRHVLWKVNTLPLSGLFPIGTNSNYYPIEVNYPSVLNSGTLTASFVNSHPGVNGLSSTLFDFSISPVVALNKAAPIGYWRLQVTGSLATSSRQHNIIVTANGFPGIDSLDFLRLVRRSNNSNPWGLTGVGIAATGTKNSPIIGRSGLTIQGGEYAIASDSVMNTLPVKLLGVFAKHIHGVGNQLNWSTSWEQNSDRFEIERRISRTGNLNSKDEWEIIGSKKAAGNSLKLNKYSFRDSQIQDNDKVVYYRLKQFDFDGSFYYSPVVQINQEEIQQSNVHVYPNPVTGESWLENNGDLALTGVLVGMDGQLFDMGEFPPQSAQLLNLNDVPNGVYTLKFHGNSSRIKLVISR